MYQNPYLFYTACQKALEEFIEEGLAFYPDAEPSHLCTTSATDDDYKSLESYAPSLGTVFQRPHDGVPVIWIRLHEPLTYKAYRVNWLEITTPAAHREAETRPYMLVFARTNFGPREKRPSLIDPSFLQRCQSFSAVEIVQPE